MICISNTNTSPGLMNRPLPRPPYPSSAGRYIRHLSPSRIIRIASVHPLMTCIGAKVSGFPRLYDESNSVPSSNVPASAAIDSVRTRARQVEGQDWSARGTIRADVSTWTHTIGRHRARKERRRRASNEREREGETHSDTRTSCRARRDPRARSRSPTPRTAARTASS
eukprot:29196-Pelagococcus_subviridis.AAC.3